MEIHVSMVLFRRSEKPSHTNNWTFFRKKGTFNSQFNSPESDAFNSFSSSLSLLIRSTVSFNWILCTAWDLQMPSRGFLFLILLHTNLITYINITFVKSTCWFQKRCLDEFSLVHVHVRTSKSFFFSFYECLLMKRCMFYHDLQLIQVPFLQRNYFFCFNSVHNSVIQCTKIDFSLHSKLNKLLCHFEKQGKIVGNC